MIDDLIPRYVGGRISQSFSKVLGYDAGAALADIVKRFLPGFRQVNAGDDSPVLAAYGLTVFRRRLFRDGPEVLPICLTDGAQGSGTAQDARAVLSG